MKRNDAFTVLHSALLQRREALRRSLSCELDLIGEDPQVGDAIDAAVDEFDDSFYATRAEYESAELAQVNRALERMHEGTYGRCEECGRSIPLARLRAVAHAALCVQCQIAADAGQTKNGGGSGRWRLRKPR